MTLKTILFSLFGICQLNAQVSSTYNFSNVSSTYTEISAGTVLGNTTSNDECFIDPVVPLGTNTPNTLNVGFPIGFSFSFNGYTFDRFSVSANGWISLGISSLTGTNDVFGQIATNPISILVPLDPNPPKKSLIKPAELRSRISALGYNLAATATSEIRFQTLGVAPNRVLVVQWKNYSPRNGSGVIDTAHVYNFQIKLYETSNIIDVVYGNMLFGFSGYSAQVGLGGNDETDYHNRWVSSNVSSTNSWAASDSGIGFSAAIGCDMVNTIPPPALGATFRWSPTNLTRNDYIFKGLKVYPNEVESILKISNNKQITSVVVYDIFGKELVNQLINDFNASVNLTSLSSGNYFVKVFSENQSKTVKIIKK